MPSGQSYTTWFPELKNSLKTRWEHSLNIEAHFDLMRMLNERLIEIRRDLNVKAPMFFCKHCNKRHAGKLQLITITAMYFALERFEICSHEEHLELRQNWKKYSKQKLINIHGKFLEEDNKTRKQNKC